MLYPWKMMLNKIPQRKKTAVEEVCFSDMLKLHIKVLHGTL
jgi:hypothetical protein